MTKKKTYDIVDIITEFKNKFPHVELVVYEVEKAIGRDYYTFYKFRLKRLFNIVFEPEVKTSLTLVKDDEITEFEFSVMMRQMEESFSLKKLMGV